MGIFIFLSAFGWSFGHDGIYCTVAFYFSSYRVVEIERRSKKTSHRHVRAPQPRLTGKPSQLEEHHVSSFESRISQIHLLFNLRTQVCHYLFAAAFAIPSMVENPVA